MENLSEAHRDKQSAAQARYCLHCKSALGAREQEFCCPGCEHIYQSIKTLGLEGFYQLRGNVASPTGLSLAPDRSYAYLDDAEVSSQIAVSLEEGIFNVRFYLPTIHCPACAWILERLPMVVDGVRRCRVNLTSNEIELNVDRTRLPFPQLAAVLHSIGYPPVPAVANSIKASEAHERRSLLMRIGIAAVAAANTMMLADPLIQSAYTGMEPKFLHLFAWASIALAIPVVTYCAIPFYRAAIGSLIVGRVHIDIPISAAILSAFSVDLMHVVQGKGSLYLDSITCLVFLLLVARYVHMQALRRARRSAGTIWDFLPAHVRVLRHGTLLQVPLKELSEGDVIEVRVNERLPVDGVIVEGASALDYSMLSGESLPREASIGDQVLAGGLNRGSIVRLEVSAVGERTRFGQLLALFKNSQTRPPWIEQLAQQLSLWFTGAVLLGSFATFAVWQWIDASRALDVTISLLIITCPCALGLAIPITVAVALGQATRSGLFVQNAQALYQFSKIRSIYFDKTGTLTEGNLRVDSYCGDRALLPLIKALAQCSNNHPVAQAIESYCVSERAEEVRAEQRLGLGVSGNAANGERIFLGSLRWINDEKIDIPTELQEAIDRAIARGCTVSLFAYGTQCRSFFALSDTVRPEARAVISALASQGICSHILSGDQQAIVETVAAQLGIARDNAHGDLFPEAKSEILKAASTESAFVGDGMNDAHALKAANVGIALRGGIEAGVEIADIFIAQGDLRRLLDALNGSRKMQRVMNRNIGISCAYNVCCALLAVTGNVSPFFAALAMPFSSLVVVLSSTLPRYFTTE